MVRFILTLTLLFSLLCLPTFGQEEENKPENSPETSSTEVEESPSVEGDDENLKLSERIDRRVESVNKVASGIVFYSIPVGGEMKVPIVLILLGFTAVFLTIYFGFINVRGFGVALRTARGKYTDPSAQGEITHFQALTAALSATVGLGNIAGVAVAIGLGGPGATFWMILMGLCGMTTKFAECTLGVKYRRIDKKGKVHGGAMYYLRDGFKEIGIQPIGSVLAVLFAIFVIGGAFGAGNMFQANQAYSQFGGTFLPVPEAGADTSWMAANSKVIFGVILAILVGLVIIGGIVSIARVTSLLVPLMCGVYVAAALFIIFTNLGEVIPAFGLIFKSAFSAEAVGGGIIGVLIQGIKRAAFSNEAGLGSAPIAHSAVKTDRPASEGFVALLEPFIDTVVVCTMTALVIIITGTWQVSGEIGPDGATLTTEPGSSEVVKNLEPGNYVHTRNSESIGEDDDAVAYNEVIGIISAEDRSETKINGWVESSAIIPKGGVTVTSMSFETAFSWFPKILAISVLLFAFSTMISWSYYGEQGVVYLFSFLEEEKRQIPVVVYKVVFCLLIIVGSSATLDNVLGLSDALVFAMVAPNLIGLYFLLPVIKKEANSYLEHVKAVDRGEG